MFDAVTDDMIDVMGVAGNAGQVPEGLRRYEAVLDHIMLYPPSVGVSPERVEHNIRELIPLRTHPIAARPAATLGGYANRGWKPGRRRLDPCRN